MKKCLKLVLVPVALFVTITGCSKAQLQRFAYNLGTQQSCMDANEHRYNESMRDLECMTQNSEKDQAYEKYQRAREDEFLL